MGPERRQRLWDGLVAAVAVALFVHLPLPAAGGAASVRDHVESLLPQEGVLGDVLLRTIDSKDLEPGQQFSHSFQAPGGFAYHCHPHPWMRALVVVEPGEAGREPATHTIAIVEGLPDDPEAWGYLPALVTVKTGDIVVWTNEGSMVHTVTGNMAPVTNLEEADQAVEEQQKAETLVYAISFLGGGVIGVLMLWFMVRRVRQLQY